MYSGLIEKEPALAGGEHIYQLFKGKYPASMDKKWLLEKPVLNDLVSKAIKLAFKLSLDAYTLYDLEYLNENQALLESIKVSVGIFLLPFCFNYFC